LPEVSGLYYESAGKSDGPPLILSSGLGGSASYWAPNLAALGEKYKLILYDHRGTGRSSRNLPDPVTVSAFADDIVTLMDGIGIERAHLIGHAAGGVAGLTLALKAPERIDKLVVVNGWAAPDPHFARCFDTRLALLRDSGVRAYIHAQPIFLFPAEWISEHAAHLDAEEDGQFAHFPAVETMEKRISALRAFDISMALGEITTPVLALSAADDMLVPAKCSDQLVEGIPNAVGERMIWGGHACNVTDVFNFNKLVLNFLGG
jgi:aminoacrylate hydrolase